MKRERAPESINERNLAILAMHKGGGSNQEVAAEFHISQSRVSQIVHALLEWEQREERKAARRPDQPYKYKEKVDDRAKAIYADYKARVPQRVTREKWGISQARVSQIIRAMKRREAAANGSASPSLAGVAEQAAADLERDVAAGREEIVNGLRAKAQIGTERGRTAPILRAALEVILLVTAMDTETLREMTDLMLKMHQILVAASDAPSTTTLPPESKRKTEGGHAAAGGRARALSLTPEQRTEIAKLAAAGRWGSVRD
jgi:hypothetical protein